MNIDKMMSDIQAFLPPRAYRMEFCEMDAMREFAQNDVYSCMVYAFRLGYLKAQRATKTELKQKYRLEMEKHAPGYGLLMALCEKNMGNERFVQIMAAYARALDGASPGGEPK